MPSWTNPKTYSTDEILTSADMNSYQRDNMLHLFEREVVGSVSSTGTGGSSHSGTINFGTTFTAPPNVIITVFTAGLLVAVLTNITTTTAAYTVATPGGGNFSSAYTVYWHAHGEQT